MASIVFAYTAIEAFANQEIPEDFKYEEQRDAGLVAIRDKDWVERNTSLDEKLATILPQILGKASPKGLKIWEGYVYLRRLRNRIIHLKSADRARSKADNLLPDSIWRQLLDPKQPDYPVTAKKMLLHFCDGETTHWLKYCPF